MKHFGNASFTTGLLAVGLLMPLTSLWGAAKSVPVPTPGAAEIVAKVAKTHPRLLLSSSDFARLRRDCETVEPLKAWRDNVKKNADRTLRQAPSKYEIPDGLRLLATSRRVVDRVYQLAMMYRLSGEQKYADRAWKELETAANFKDWNPRHFLDTAEMAHAFAIGYDWLFDAWTPAQKATLRQAMLEKGLTLGVACHRGAAPKGVSSFWARADHNWNQVCNGGLGMAALALADEQPALCGEFLAAALKSIQLAMVEYGPDGAWGEGPGYWDYATSYNVVFLAGLESACGTDFKLSTIPGFSEAGSFPIFVMGPAGKSFSYADAHEGRISSSSLFWLARKFNRPEYARFQLDAIKERGNPRDLVWYDPKTDFTKLKQAPLDKYFRGPEIVSLRGAWGEPNASFVALKAGDNKVNHSHLDIGSFALDALGVRWATDLGADNYNMPGYFGSQRWTYYRLRAEGHNTLVLDPGKEADQDPKAATQIIKFQSSPKFAFAIADLTTAYAKNAASVLRGAALVNRSQILIQDEVRMKHAGDYHWFMHTPAQVEVDPTGTVAVLTCDKKRLLARLLSPSTARFKVMASKPLPSSPNPEKQGNNDKTKKLSIHLRVTSDCRVAVAFLPCPDGVTPTGAPPQVTPLLTWAGK